MANACTHIGPVQGSIHTRSKRCHFTSLHFTPTQTNSSEWSIGDPLASENRTHTIDINGFIFIHGQNVRRWKRPWHPPGGPEHRAAASGTVLYSLPSAREAQAACPCAESSHSLPVAALRRCTIFNGLGELIGPPSRGHSEKGHSQPHRPALTARPLPPRFQRVWQGCRTSRTSSQSNVAASQNFPWLSTVRVVIEARCFKSICHISCNVPRRFFQSPVWFATKITSPCCAGNIRTLPTCAHCSYPASSIGCSAKHP